MSPSWVTARIELERSTALPAAYQVGTHRVSGDRWIRPCDACRDQLPKIKDLLSETPVDEKASLGPEVADLQGIA